MTPSKRMNVILDLDATIISSLDPGKIIKGLSFHIMTEKIKGKEVPIFYVYERPYLQDFLDYLFENFNVGVWTAATKDYGSFIVEKIIAGKLAKERNEIVLLEQVSIIDESKKIKERLGSTQIHEFIRYSIG